MKNKEKKIIIIIALICILIIGLIISLIVFLKKAPQDEKAIENEGKQAIGLEQLNKTKDIDLFCTINECIKTYLTMIKAGEQEVVFSYLNEEYINVNQINTQNVFNIIKPFKNYDSYRTIEMYEKFNVENRYGLYFVRGKIDGNYIYLKVGIDENNETFDIYPINEELYNKQIVKDEQNNENQQASIPKKTYNFYRYAHITNEELARMYYVDYIKLMFTDTEQAYKMLNEQYKNAKFGSIDNFKNYININKEFLLSTYNVETADTSNYNNYSEYYKYVESKSDFKMKNYSVNNYNEYTQCICGNITGSNWIFNAKYPMDYEVYLDTYTIDLPEFTEKYNKQTNENKVTMNIEKVKAALNTGDYSYIYKKLDETFKKNKFAEQKAFEQYMKANLFEFNKFEYDSVKKESEIYIASIKITDAAGKNNNSKLVNIVMKLLEGTDFVMSFSFK